MTDDLPSLAPTTCRAYLRRLGISSFRRDFDGLVALQTAHLRALPFHNLLLLAGDGADPGLPTVEAAVEGSLRGWGGTCHLLTPPFVTLLRALGFDAWLAAGSVGAPGDHLVGVVRVGGRRFICDVGNGHPYLCPFPVDSLGHGGSAYGWEFRFEPVEHRGSGPTHRLLRRLDDGSWKTVYSLDPQPVDYATFAGIIRAHHTSIGFGPFMTGLRAVRMTSELLVTLRDATLERFHVSGRLPGRRPVASEAVGRVLERCFGLGELPWQAALDVLERRAPARAGPERGLEAIRVLMSVGLTDRPGALRRIGLGLLRARRAAGLQSDAVGLLAVDNGTGSRGDLAGEVAALRGEGLAVEVVSRSQLAGWHARLHAQGLIADPPATAIVGIASCRMLQVVALWEHLSGIRTLPGLPQAEGAAPLLVWMIDDDLDWSQLGLKDGALGSRPADRLLSVAAQLWRDHPEASVLVGGTTGCPPVPGLAMVASQVVDLLEHVRRAASQGPTARYVFAENDRRRVDYYYDHSDVGPAHSASFAWEPVDMDDLDVRAALLMHLRAVPGLTWGQPCTRLVVSDPLRAVTPTTARGGNALFLDLDSLFSAPPLALRCEDGIVTRRGDTVWGELMAQQFATGVYTAPLALHHVRVRGDHSSPLADGEGDVAATRRFHAAQMRGTVLARLVGAAGQVKFLSAAEVLRDREDRVRDSLARASEALSELAGLASVPEGWLGDDPEVLAALSSAIATLQSLLTTLFAATGARSTATVAEELTGFAAAVPRMLAQWKELWR